MDKSADRVAAHRARKRSDALARQDARISRCPIRGCWRWDDQCQPSCTLETAATEGATR